MTATSRQTQHERRPFHRERGTGRRMRHWLLLLGLLLSALALPGSLRAAPGTVVGRRTADGLTTSARHALLPALLPGAEVAAPQPRPEPLPLPPALPPTALRLLAAGLVVTGPTPTRRGAGPAHFSATARLTSEVPNGP